MTLTLPTSDFQGMQIAEFDTTTLLEHAAKQARQRKYQDLFIVDVDSHHYENESVGEINQFLDDEVLRHLAIASSGLNGMRTPFTQAPAVGNQDQGGRVMRYPLRSFEKTGEQERHTELTRRWMDSMGIDMALLFPTQMLTLSTHPVLEVQTQLARAYNRWLVECIIPKEPRIRTLLYLPLYDPEACYQMVLEFGDKPGVSGFLVTATHNIAVHDNALMKTYAALEERNLPISFHGSFNWSDQAVKSTNRFISVHALGFVWYNLVHMTNWIVNGLPERFPKLKVIWMESGLAWIPFIMQRLDNEYMMRSNECPALKQRPSDYMRQMYYSTQPMEIQDMGALQTTFRMINAETQLMYSSDYPHWDFDLPSTIYDLPFLSEQAKKNILGETAAKVFNLERPEAKLAKIPGL
jgi:predicted TIM-barrel fold metal-dependent hydrolase